MNKRDSLRRKHPVEPIPFEALYHGSWHGVDLISIRNGHIFIQLNYYGSVIEETICGYYIRLRSRKACASDCLNILKIGVDVCVLSTYPITECSDEVSQKPVLSWLDAKIISIKKDHQGGRCACRFSVMLYKNKSPISTANGERNRVTSEMVTIDRIAVLQKLHCEPCEDGFHSWNYSEDWTASKRSKLLLGSISSEISWLVVYSILKGMNFDIKLVQSRVVYHILNYAECSHRIHNVQYDSDSEATSPNSEETMKVLSFRKRSNETMQTKIETLTNPALQLTMVPDKTDEKDLGYQSMNSDSDVEVLYDYSSLRRSKRQKILPERFTSYTEPNFNRPTKKSPFDLEEFEESTAMVARLLLEEESSHCLEDRSLEELVGYLPSNNLSDVSSSLVVVVDSSDSESSDSAVEIDETSDSDNEFILSKPPAGSKGEGLQSRTIQCWKLLPPPRTRDCSSRSDRKRYSRKKKALTENSCKQLIEKFMESTEPEACSQLKADVQGTLSMHGVNPDDIADFRWSSESETEVDQCEELWEEMDDSLATLNLLEQKQKLDNEFFGGTVDTSDYDSEQCQHEYRLDEQIGLVCQLCNFVCTEIRYISQQFKNDGQFTSRENWDMEDLLLMGLYDLELDPNGNVVSSSNVESSEMFDSVWTPISNLKPKLHLHQKNAFEFIWRNIAGSLKPQQMSDESGNTGGCVISHSPGSGKTLLVISFLVSYLKLFPGSRPLVLAPKTAVYVWWKEMEKWGVSTPVHLIHPFESFKKEVWEPNIKHSSSTGDRRPNVKMMHVIDCLSKFKQWHQRPSILLMSYPTFFSFTFKESKLEHRRFMADILQKKPGLLILDEGHNPRSTRSKLRKQLMKVNTDLRILLSGTLFQNNFEEYFNTLTLARPRFVDDVIKALDPRKVNTLDGRKQKMGKRTNQKERLARKLFVEEVGQKIESVMEEERKQGFALLNMTTNGFIDMHDGSRRADLPGIHVYTLMLTSTDIQKEILTKLQNSITQKRCPLELELLITVGSIHPWLIKTVVCVDDFFNPDELDKVEKYKKNFTSGSKVKFVIDIVHKSSMSGEKVLVFCHNISPISFLVDLFANVFGWSKGEEVLVLQGDQELFERARVMEKFNSESKNKCRVLLASTLACAEGISLTAASRVVLLDSEWNHSKTRQAIARAFRPGQKKMVYVYRLLALGTWEEDKYHSNEWKAWLSKMIFIGQYINFQSSKQVVNLEDEMLKEVVEEDQGQTIQMIMKQE